MSKYLLFLKNQIGLVAVYRFELFTRWILNSFEIVIAVALWSLTTNNQQELYRLIAYFALYYWSFNNFHTSRVGTFIGKAIHSGELNHYLTKPINFPFTQVLRTVTVVIVRVAVPISLLFLGAIFAPQIFAPDSLTGFMGFLTFGLIGIVIWNFLVVTIGTLAFTGTEIGSTLTVLDLVINLAKGAYIPAYLFPDWADKMLSYTFIPYLLSFPIRLYQEPVPFSQISKALVVSLFWAGFFAISSKFLYQRGLARYEAQGA